VHPNQGGRGHAHCLESPGPNLRQNFGPDRHRYTTLTLD
jgi:hypothetical protein